MIITRNVSGLTGRTVAKFSWKKRGNPPKIFLKMAASKAKV
jgi:hypothetical protein